MDFSNSFSVEIYGKRGWEVVGYFTSWDIAAENAATYSGNYQVRVTSPYRGNVGFSVKV